MKRIILASTSVRRKEIFEILDIPFEIEGSSYEEDMTLVMPPEKLAMHLSLGKAQAVAERHTDSIIIAADSFVALENHVLGKPKNKQEAKAMLRKLSGKAHSIITGLTIIDTKTQQVFSDFITATVHFKTVTDKEIETYVASNEPMDKAGAYALQGKGSLFIEKFEGDFFGAVGLPLKRVAEILTHLDISIL